MKKLKYSIHRFVKPIGFCYVVVSDCGLREIAIGISSKSECVSNIRKKYGSRVLSHNGGTSIADKLRRYFGGETASLDYGLDLSWSTEFEKDVYAVLREVPYGKTVGYGDIATAIGKPLAFRAVGNALGRNELPIVIHCHRVVNSNGALGGFSAGLHIKRFLLKLEGCI